MGMATISGMIIRRGRAPVKNQASSPRRPHILVVDDDIHTREMNAAILLRSGYAVDTAEDGAEAWQALQDARYDLLITDHQMPRVTGLELIQKLRSEAMTLPVILTSGAVPTVELQRLPSLKIDAVVEKPLALDVFLRTVNELLSLIEGFPGERGVSQ